MRVWDADSGKTLATLQGHTAAVFSAAFSPDGKRIVTASYDNTARVWDADSGKTLASLQGHTAGVITAAFSPDGKRVVTASCDTTARVWDADSGKTLATLQGHTARGHHRRVQPRRQAGRHGGLSRQDGAGLGRRDSGQLLALLEGHTVFRLLRQLSAPTASGSSPPRRT